MKYCYFLPLLICSCSVRNNIYGTFVSDKTNNNSYNIVLTLLENKKYTIKTLSTGASGTTNGYWILEKRKLILYPESPKYSEEKIGDSIYKFEEYHPFSDTLRFKVKNNKLVKINTENSLILHKI